MDYLDLLMQESNRFASTLAATHPTEPVPSCPDWTAADLLWHLTEVQSFWGTIVRDRLAEPEAAEAAAPERPESFEDVFVAFSQASTALQTALAQTDPAEPVWTWSNDHTAGFVRRRQVHEALIHRVDAELTAGRRTPIEAGLAADGVLEFLQFMQAPPSWARVEPAGPIGALNATDTGAGWLVRVGHFSGLSPNTGTTYEAAPCLCLLAEPGRPGYAIDGTVADLDCWLWQREPAGPVIESGDPAGLAQLGEILREGVQ